MCDVRKVTTFRVTNFVRSINCTVSLLAWQLMFRSNYAPELQKPLLPPNNDDLIRNISLESIDDNVLSLRNGKKSVKQSRTSIFSSSPPKVKYIVPILIVMNILCFVLANINVGASVLLSIDVFGESFEPIGLFDFSLINTIVDMYSAKAYTLSILVCVWSGVWPYAKLVFLLVCWFARETHLSQKSRHYFLVFMDFFGKWCLLDLFLVVTMSVAFKFDIVYPEENRFLKLNVSILNGTGVYAFLLATLLSLIMSHLVFVYHKNASRAHENLKGYRQFLCPCPPGSWFNLGSSQKSWVSDKRFSVVYFLKNNEYTLFKTRPRRLVMRTCLVFVMVLNIGSILLGVLLKSFSFTYTGVLAELISFVAPEKLVQSYSVLGIGLSLTDDIDESLCVGNTKLVQYSQTELLGIYWIQLLFLCFCIYLPLVEVIFLFALWLIPMNLRDQKIVFYAAEVISSWSALEVYAVCQIATKFQIALFARFLLQEECDIIEELFKEDCFSVRVDFLEGQYFLIVGALLLPITAGFTFYYVGKCIDQREEESLALLSKKSLIQK